MSAAAPERFGVYGFASTHDALDAERSLKEAGIRVVPVPSPPALGELCGIAMRVARSDIASCEATMRREGIAWTARVDVEQA